MIGFGVPAGAKMPHHASAVTPGKPCSASVGLVAGDGDGAHLPALYVRREQRYGTDTEFTLPA
jgi:hypothetical protein